MHPYYISIGCSCSKKFMKVCIVFIEKVLPCKNYTPCKTTRNYLKQLCPQTNVDKYVQPAVLASNQALGYYHVYALTILYT